MVTAREPSPNLVTKNPLTKPHAVPTAIAIRIESQIGAPAAYDQPSIALLRAKIEAIDKSISPVMMRKIIANPMIRISLEFEKICETLIELKKLSVVIDAKTQTEKSRARIAVSQDLRTLKVFFSDTVKPFP